MKKCDKHKKDYVGGCMWCGTRLCELCIAKQEGVKLYCEKCYVKLGSVRRERLPQFGVPRPPSNGRRYVLKNGYLELQGVDE